MSNNIKFLAIFILTISYFTGCLNQKKQETSFFESLKKRGNKSLLSYIQQKHDDSLYKIQRDFVGLYPEYMLNSFQSKRAWPSFLDSNFTKENLYIMDEILLFSFKRYLNNEQINLEKIKCEVEESNLRYKKEVKQIKIEKFKERALLISNNDNKSNINDTLMFTFGLEREDGNLVIDYNYYPSSLTMENAVDTLILYAILLEKFYIPAWSTFAGSIKNHPLNMSYKVKVLSMNRKKVGFNSYKVINLGDTIDVILSFYGRNWDVVNGSNNGEIVK